MICLFCGKPNTYRDEAFTTVIRPEAEYGWHPACWPNGEGSVNDLILRRTPQGIRGRVRP